MRRWPALVLLVLLLAGCAAPAPDDEPSPTTTTPATTSPTPPSTAPTTPTTPPTLAPTPTLIPTPTPVPTPTPGGATPPAATVPTANVTFRVRASTERLDLRFPVLWGPSYPARPMARVGDTFEATVPLPLGALVRYGYGDPFLDHDHREQFDPGAEPWRVLVVNGSRIVEDEAFAFGPESVARPAVMEGRVRDRASGAPLVEAWVSADGVLTSTIDGYYRAAVRDRPTIVTVFTLDGSYRAASFEAIPGKLDVALDAAPRARVRIEATGELPPRHELRLFSTAAQTGAQMKIGNDLAAETYVTMPDGTATLDLREGQWVDYLYSVGNTALSYERGPSIFVVRGFAAKDGLVVRDTLGPFLDERASWFNVTVPAYTDPNDTVRVVDLDPRLLAMHRVDATRWTIALAGEDVAGRTYRYARTWSAPGVEIGPPRTATRSNDDVVGAWRYQQTSDAPTPTFALPPVAHRFDVAVTLPDWYGQEHAHAIAPWVSDIASQGFHAVVLNQVWGVTSLDPPRLERSGPGFSLYMPAYEAKRVTSLAHAQGIRVELEQQLGTSGLSGEREFNATWWNAFLLELERMNVENARLAQAAGIDAMSVIPAHPAMLYPVSYAAEYDAAMERIISSMRKVFDGELVVLYDEFRRGPLDHWRSADRITQVTYDLAAPANATQAQLDAWVSNLFATRYKPQADAAGVPLTIKFGAQSTDGAISGRTVPEAVGPATAVHEAQAEVDVEEQRMIYEAFFKAANANPWIGEMNVWVYGPVDAPLTRDVDVRGKPAAEYAAAWARAMTRS